MYPIFLQIGPITIYALQVFIAVGCLMALLMLNKLIQKDRNKLSFIADHSVGIFLGGLIMSRIIFLLQNVKVFFTQPILTHFVEIFYIWDKGMSFWGGLLGIAIMLVYYCRKKQQNPGAWLDIFVISASTGLVFGNIGTFLDGRNYGRETTLPWGVLIENSRYAVPIHPVQIYAVFYTLILTIFLFQFLKSNMGKVAGNTAIIGVTIYAFLRFLEEFLRGDESNYFFFLREAQIYCAIAFITGCVLMYRRIKKYGTGMPVLNNTLHIT